MPTSSEAMVWNWTNRSFPRRSFNKRRIDWNFWN